MTRIDHIVVAHANENRGYVARLDRFALVEEGQDDVEAFLAGSAVGNRGASSDEPPEVLRAQQLGVLDLHNMSEVQPRVHEHVIKAKSVTRARKVNAIVTWMYIGGSYLPG